MRNRQLSNQECVIECISGNLVSQLRIPICPLPVLYRIYSILNGKEIIYRSLKLKKKIFIHGKQYFVEEEENHGIF